MAQSQLNLGPLEVQAVDRLRTNAGSVSGPTLDPSGTDGLSLLIDAVEASKVTGKEVYLSLGLPDQSYWNKVRNREKPEPRIGKLTDLPDLTQRAMVQKWARQLRMTVTDADEKTAAVAELAEAAIRALKLLVG